MASFILFEKENPLATISLPGKLLPASVSQYLSGNEEALLPKKTKNFSKNYLSGNEEALLP